MTQESEDSSVRFDEEMGVHHTRPRLETEEVDGSFDFEVETEAVFKRLAEDIYKGKEAGVREPLTNSVTSVIRASTEGYLENKDEGIIVFNLYDDGESLKLTMRDNGVGLTREEIDRVVTQIGKSTTRTQTNLTGQFGMGFLATWMLAGGTDGGFIMHSNPRGVDEGPFTGIWDSNGFSEVSGLETISSLGDDDYGVLFEIFIDQNITREELENWIDSYSEWTRVPVLFRKHNDDGTVVDEEYPDKSILDKYEAIQNGTDPEEFGTILYRDAELNHYTFEHDAFTAVNSNLRSSDSSLNKLILMDVPISMNWRISRKFPLNTIEIRLNYETPIVVDGPHQGKFVASKNEAKNLGSDFISVETLTTEDVVTPHPTGTRDMVNDDTGFMEWLGEKFYDQYYEDIAGILQNIDTLAEYCDLSDDDREFFHEVLREVNDTYHLNQRSLKNIESRTKTTFDSDFAEVIPELHNSHVSVAPEGHKGVSRKDNRESIRLRNLIPKTHNTNKSVYMGHRITQDKAEFVWTAEGDHYVVQVNSGRQDVFNDVLGWKSLSDIDYETDLEMSDAERNKFTEDNTEPKDERVTLHLGSYSNTKSMTAKELMSKVQNKDIIVDDNDESYVLEKLIIFKRNGHNISDNDSIVGSVIGTVSLSNEVYEYIKGTENTWTAEEALDKEMILPASDGEYYNIHKELDENIVTHVMDESTIEKFRDEDVMESVQEWVRARDETPDDCVYLPVTRFEKQFASMERHWRDWSIETEYNHSSYHRVSVSTDVELYAEAVIDNDDPVVDALKTVGADWENGGKEIVELVEENL